MFLILLLVSYACNKRREIEAGEDQMARVPKAGTTEQPSISESTLPAVATVPTTNTDWRKTSPLALQGNWASSLFQDQRCTAFYTFAEAASAELNLICLNSEKKQFEREFRRYEVAEYPGTQQLRFKQVGSSCPEADSKTIKSDGAAFLYSVDGKPADAQGVKLALWEPNVSKQPLNLSKTDGLMAEGFPGKAATYLGMTIVSGCFGEGLVANFKPSIIL